MSSTTSMDRIEHQLLARIRELEEHLNRLRMIVMEQGKLLRSVIDAPALDASAPSDQHPMMVSPTQRLWFHAMRIASNLYHVEASQVAGKERTAKVAMARQFAHYLMKAHGEMTFIEVAKVASRTHGTIMNSVREVQDRLSLIGPNAERSSSVKLAIAQFKEIYANTN